MELLTFISKIGIYAAMAFILATALAAVIARNIFHAALALAFSLLGVAIIYFILHAEFLGAMQILIYVGAVMTLIIFTVMLTSRISDRTVPTSNRQRYPVAILVLILLTVLVRIVVEIPWPLKENLTAIGTIQIGKALMGAYVFPFELISLVLVAALIGAIVIARGDE